MLSTWVNCVRSARKTWRATIFDMQSGKRLASVNWLGTVKIGDGRAALDAARAATNGDARWVRTRWPFS